MSAKITTIKPAEQSCLAHAQPLRARLATTLALMGCRTIRVARVSTSPYRWITLAIETDDGQLHEIALQDLPSDVISRLEAALAAAEPEGK